jgi:hypothetical protein
MVVTNVSFPNLSGENEEGHGNLKLVGLLAEI